MNPSASISPGPLELAGLGSREVLEQLVGERRGPERDEAVSGAVPTTSPPSMPSAKRTPHGTYRDTPSVLLRSVPGSSRSGCKGCHRNDRLTAARVISQRAVEGLVAEAEDPAVLSDHQVSVAVCNHADDGSIQ